MELFTGGAWEHAGFEDFCRRVMTEATDPDLRAAGRVAYARFPYVRGELADAERLTREALETTFDTGTRTELAACINLALVCLGQRRLFESLVLARRSCALAERLNERRAVCYANLHLAGVLDELGDGEGAERALATTERHLGGCEAQTRRNHERNIAYLRAEFALRRGDTGAARRQTERCAALWPEDRAPCALDTLKASVLVAESDHAGARAILDHVQPPAGGRDRTAFERALLAARCRLHLEGPDAADAAACALLARLREDAAREVLSPGERMEVAEALARLLEECDAKVEARRALGVAGAAALERTGELDRFLRRLPALQEASPTDRALLEDFRRRYADEHRELLDAVARLFEADPAAAAELAAGEDDDPTLICACAWCKRVRGPEGVWVNLWSFLPPEGPVSLTHGVCEACHAELMTEVRSQG